MIKWLKKLWKSLSKLRGKVEAILDDVSSKVSEGQKALDEKNIDKVRDIFNKIQITIDIAKKIL